VPVHKYYTQAHPIFFSKITPLKQPRTRKFSQKSHTPSARKTRHQDVAWAAQYRKAAGHNGMQRAVLKHIPLTAFKFMSTADNFCALNNYFPTRWKIAKLAAPPARNNGNS
jgi:hypothetical protein